MSPKSLSTVSPRPCQHRFGLVDLTTDDAPHAIRRLQRELDKKEKALTKAATMLMLSKKFNQIFRPDEEPLFQAADLEAIVTLLQEGINHGASARSVANLFGLATRTLRRWGLTIRAQGFSCDQRKGATRPPLPGKMKPLHPAYFNHQGA